MEFKIAKKDDENLHRYPTDDLRLARHFSEKISNELGEFVVAVVLFGSSARAQATEKSDIDVLVVGNDLDFTMSEAFIEAYRIIIEKLIATTSTRLHITSMTESSLWEFAKVGDPIVTNILREGVSLYDSGTFRPLQHLLRQGRIRPTEESVWRYFARSPKTLQNSRWHILQATLDLYWAAIDSAHAALMSRNQIPPTPDHVADLLHEIFVTTKELDPKYVKMMKMFYDLNKKISHRDVKIITGKEYEQYYEQANEFVTQMRKLIYKHIH